MYIVGESLSLHVCSHDKEKQYQYVGSPFLQCYDSTLKHLDRDGIQKSLIHADGQAQEVVERASGRTRLLPLIPV